MTLDRFYLIVNSTDWIERLLPVGLKLVQLRVKDQDEATVLSQIREASRLCNAAGATLIVNDHWEAALTAGADWVHLGQEDLDTADVGALRRAGIRLGLSTHTPEELDRALQHAPDYVALGPIFEARGKKVDYPTQGLGRIGEWRRRVTCPLVAIGGLTLESAASVYAAGADSVCVITDVLNHPDPEARCRDWLAARETWRRS
ncbi:thiamine phosphate synthase [Microvirga tunisiensis]|uniref:Thiamine phosphate synthase n=2 Tax=Pannonibacter tanglangensis TaxID=2750084 RepID=A0ABW9ZI61_9HYPH|nr:thiamine phosphate synthase [Pannonibacter sp. XCT-34]NBN77380.1 thiamine phosphate synthase [Pannonibacter sp. XCT-53]